MIVLHKPVRRVSSGSLDGSFGTDRNKRIVISLIPGDGKDIPDLIELRPHGTRRAERIAVLDVYRYAMRCRVNNALLVKAREAKSRKATRLASQRQARAEARLRRPIQEAA